MRECRIYTVNLRKRGTQLLMTAPPILLLTVCRAVAEGIVNSVSLMEEAGTDKTRLQALHLFSVEEIFRYVVQAAPFTTRTGVGRIAPPGLAIFSGWGEVLLADWMMEGEMILKLPLSENCGVVRRWRKGVGSRRRCRFWGSSLV